MKLSLPVKVASVLLVLLMIGSLYMLWTLTDKEKKQSSEAFIRTYLLQPDGFIRTTITDRADEYLSESMGLWMLYLVESDEPKRFKTQVKTLQAEFLTADHLVTWQIIGHKKASANALIDDIRIVQALYTASEKWNKPTYQSLADQMSRSIARYQTIEGILTDFVETSNKEVGTELTLSYIVPQALDLMVERKLLSNDVYLKTQQVLLDAPITENGLFPRSYSTRTSRYTYDADVHMIDQFYTGYHRAVWDGDVTGLMSFTKQVFLDGGHKLYGRYDRTTRKPTVTFESAAVYALASMMFREVGETEFADQLLNRMEQLAVQDKASPYYGGYIDVQTKDTHSFDNLLALLAEQQSEMK